MSYDQLQQLRARFREAKTRITVLIVDDGKRNAREDGIKGDNLA